MKIEDTKQLLHGIYRLHWREGGGSSLAVVGSMKSGARWFACADWTGKDGKGIPGSDNAESWAQVEKAELIEAVERPRITEGLELTDRIRRLRKCVETISYYGQFQEGQDGFQALLEMRQYVQDLEGCTAKNSKTDHLAVTKGATAIHRIAALLYDRNDHGVLVTNPRTVGQEQLLIQVMQDILEQLIIDANSQGLSKAAVMLRECRQALDKVNGTLTAASAIASAVRSIEP